jgi:hypothetical protein
MAGQVQTQPRIDSDGPQTMALQGTSPRDELWRQVRSFYAIIAIDRDWARRHGYGWPGE